MTSRPVFARSALRTCASASFALLLSRSTEARAEDAWLGPDKALHFAAAGAIASIGYGVTTAVTEDRWKAFALGGGAAIGAGALKEAWDATGAGDPSWKDFAWDVIGAAVGLGVAWVVDVGVHGGTVPPLSANAPMGALVRF